MHWKKKFVVLDEDEPTSILDETTGNFSSCMTRNEKMAIEASMSQSQVITGEETRMQSSNTMELSTATETPVAMELNEHLVEPVLKNIKGSGLVEFFRKDQSNRTNSLTDARIVCANGWLPFHRYILTAVSPWIKKTLLNEDPSDLAVIHLPDVRVENVVQAIGVLYSGNSVYQKSSEDNIFQIFQMLGINIECFQISKSAGAESFGKLRFYETKVKSEKYAHWSAPYASDTEDDADETDSVVEVDVVDDINSELINTDERELYVEETALHVGGSTVIPEGQDSQEGVGASSVPTPFFDSVYNCSKESILYAGGSHATSYAGGANIEKDTNSQDNPQNIVCIEEDVQRDVDEEEHNIVDENNVPRDEEMQHRGPRVTITSQKRKNETAKFKKLRMSSSGKGPLITQNESNIVECHICNKAYSSEESFLKHFSAYCGSHLTGKYLYHTKQCLGCMETFPIYNIIELIAHVETCTGFVCDAYNRRSTSSPFSPRNTDITENITIFRHLEANEGENVGNTMQNEAQQNDAQESQQQNILGMNTDDDDVIFQHQVGVFITPMTVKNSTDPLRSSPSVVTHFENTSYICTSPESVSSGYTNYTIENVAENQDNGHMARTSVPKSGCSHKDISKLSIPELRLLLTKCDVCKRGFNDVTWATYCLRTHHSLRRCWICLELVPLKGKRSFQRHILKHKIPRTRTKIACPYCQKACEYKWGIDVHCRHHFAKLLGIKKERISENAPNTTETRNFVCGEQMGAPLLTPEIVNIPGPSWSSRMPIENNVENYMEYQVTSSEDDTDGDPDYVPTQSELEMVEDCEDVYDRPKPPKSRKCLSTGGNRVTILSNDENASASTSSEDCSSDNGPTMGWAELYQEVKSIQSNFPILQKTAEMNPKN